MIFEILLQHFLIPYCASLPHRDLGMLSLKAPVAVSAPLAKDSGDFLGVNVTARSALAVDARTGKVLFELNSDTPRSIASITKLMTVVVFLEQKIAPDKIVTIQEVDRHLGGTQRFMAGEEISVNDLLMAALVGSDNDAAYALARISGLGLEGFVKRMNEKAKELGMEHSTFTDPTGLKSTNQSTARDIVRLLETVADNKSIVRGTTLPSYEATVQPPKGKKRVVKLYATDNLASSRYLDLQVGKTGYIPEAGYCLATRLVGQQKVPLYIVVLGSATIDDRFQDVKAIEYYITQKFSFQ